MSPTRPKVPKYVRLAENIREQVRSGALKPGDQLPSYAQVQAQHGIGQGTLERVYMLLEQEHLIVRTPKLGTFVAEPKRRDRTNVIGVLAGVSADIHPYYAKLLNGIQDVTHEKEIELLILHKNSAINWDKMDAFIGGCENPQAPPAMPVVSLMQVQAGVPSFVTDDYHGIEVATRHLLDLGHRRIAFLTMSTPEDTLTLGSDRLRAYRDTLHSAGIDVEREWVRRLHDPWTGTTRYTDLGYEKMKLWLETGWADLGCTALLTQNDDTAIGVLHALHDAGIDVPGDVSLVGFDGLEITEHTRPPIATLVVPLGEIGAAAARYLLARLETSSLETPLYPADAPVVVVPTTWRPGASTAAPRR